MADRTFLLVPAQTLVAKWLSSFKEFPMRQKPASFSLDAVMTKIQASPAEQPLEPTGSPTGKPGEPQKSQPPEPETEPEAKP